MPPSAWDRCGGAKHVIFVSTYSNYGLINTSSLADEDAGLNPSSLYAETKVAVERALIESEGFPFTILRLATVYGSWRLGNPTAV